MASETLERPVEHPDDTGPTHGSRSLAIVLTAVVTLLLGGLAGWLLRGDDGTTNDVVGVNGAELTERQEEMMRVGEEYFAAIRDGDGDKLASLFVPQGYLTFQERTQIRVDDGSLAQYFNGSMSPGFDVYEPVLVFDDTLIYATDLAGNEVNVIKFTTSGDVLIIRSAMTW